MSNDTLTEAQSAAVVSAIKDVQAAEAQFKQAQAIMQRTLTAAGFLDGDHLGKDLRTIVRKQKPPEAPPPNGASEPQQPAEVAPS